MPQCVVNRCPCAIVGMAIASPPLHAEAYGISRSEMVRPGQKNSNDRSTDVFNYSYVVLSILLLLTIGTTLAYYQNSTAFADDTGGRWTPVVFLIGMCVSLVIFGMTRREAAARARLHRKTLDLIQAQKENKALLKAEQRSRIAAERASLAKDEFLAVVSHELKTPLNAIAGWNRILKTPGISGDVRNAALERIDKNLRMQISIVEELLSFSDIMSTDLDLPRKQVQLREVVREALEQVSVAAFQKGITIANEYKVDGGCVLGDRARLKIAFANVLDNAVKFTPSGGRVDAKLLEEDGHLNFVVIDNGLGITEEFLPYVFECYKQSEHATTRHFGGLGLGLTIAQHIVQMHHGTIAAESKGPGTGAKFTIALPTA